jgi:hypothetical protein
MEEIHFYIIADLIHYILKVETNIDTLHVIYDEVFRISLLGYGKFVSQSRGLEVNTSMDGLNLILIEKVDYSSLKMESLGELFQMNIFLMLKKLKML